MYLVWKDDTNSTTGTSDINFRVSENNGQSFKGIRNLSNNIGNSEYPQISGAANNIYIVWQDTSSGTSDIYFKGSANNGKNFKGTRNLSINTGNSESPQIATAQGDNVYVAWQDNSSGANGIYLTAVDFSP